MFLTCQYSFPASFLNPAHSYCSLLCICFIFASLDFHLFSFVAQPFHIFKFPLFSVFGTFSNSFVVSFFSPVPPELISLSEVIIFSLLWILAPFLYPAVVTKDSRSQTNSLYPCHSFCVSLQCSFVRLLSAAKCIFKYSPSLSVVAEALLVNSTSCPGPLSKENRDFLIPISDPREMAW